MGGAAYRRVRDRVEAQYELYWTPTGKKRGRQTDARERLEAAVTTAREAADRLATLERSLSDVEAARARLKIRSEEHTSELKCIMRHSYADFVSTHKQLLKILP